MDAIRDLLDVTIIRTDDQVIALWQLIVLPVAVLGGYFVAVSVIRFIASRLIARGSNPDAVQLLQRAMYVLVISILVITTLDILSVPLTAFAFVSGAIAIGVGFGAQNIINNYISGWILMWERPVRIGDFLELDGVKGTVESINTRSTRVRRSDGVHLMVPNSKLLENTVVNWTLVDQFARTEVRVGVAYGSPTRKVADLLGQAVEAEDGILASPEAQIVFEAFGESSLDFDVVFWSRAADERALKLIRSALRYRISDILSENDIVIAFPQRDVHVDGSITLDVDGRRSDA